MIVIRKPGVIHTIMRQGKKVIQIDYMTKVMDLEGWKMKPNINHNIETDLQNKPHIEETILTETGLITNIALKKKQN